MSVEINHDPLAPRFEAIVDGHRCVLDYRIGGSTMTITHTGVPSEVGGRGIASDLTRAALEMARMKGWKVVPACSYAEAYMRRHPEYADLMA